MQAFQARGETLRANAIVASDGSGDYRTAQEAINAVPQNTSATNRWIVFIKAGTDRELGTPWIGQLGSSWRAGAPFSREGQRAAGSTPARLTRSRGLKTALYDSRLTGVNFGESR